MIDFWEICKYIILGLVQGFTEPLPVSSSGHMVIVDALFGSLLTEATMNNFQIVVNFASLLAIVWYYRKLVVELATGTSRYLLRKDKSRKDEFLYVVWLIIATIPAGIAGIIIKIYHFDALFTNITVVSGCLFITGLLLLYIHRFAPAATRQTVTFTDGVMMGCAQAIGLLPGISRSGITTSFGINNKLSLEKALRFSFMMYIIASVGALGIGILDMAADHSALGTTAVVGYAGAFVASFIGTAVALRLFFRFVRNHNLKYFGYYCLTIAVTIGILIGVGVLK